MDGNLRAIVIEGNPSDKDIAQAWMNIEVEFIDAIGSTEQKAELRLFREIADLQSRLTIVEVCIQQLRLHYFPEFETEMNTVLKTNVKLDPSNPEKYKAELAKCWNRSRGLKIDLDLKNIQFKAIEEKIKAAGQGQAYTREYFATQLITLSDFAQYQLQDNITVYEYCDRLRRLVEHNARMEKLYPKNKK